MKLNLPPYPLWVERTPSGIAIYDQLRKKFVALTPEEWVRQNFTAHLINALGFPPALMANEVGLKLNGTLRRSDTVVWDRYGKPLVIVEYKAPSVRITQRTVDQITRYNMVFQAPYLIISNGLQHICCELDLQTRSYKFLPEIPVYSSIADQK